MACCPRQTPPEQALKQKPLCRGGKAKVQELLCPSGPLEAGFPPARTPSCQHTSITRSTEIPAKPRGLLPSSQLTWSDAAASTPRMSPVPEASPMGDYL